MVESTDTPTTVNSVARSFSGCAASAADSASAAEAPQIAVAPPLPAARKPGYGYRKFTIRKVPST